MQCTDAVPPAGDISVASGIKGYRLTRRGACREIQEYLTAVLDKRLPVNHDIMAGLQDVLNLLPNLNVSELTRAFAVKSNDMMLVIYVASLVRSVLALHNLLNNKVSCKRGWPVPRSLQ